MPATTDFGKVIEKMDADVAFRKAIKRARSHETRALIIESHGLKVPTKADALRYEVSHPNIKNLKKYRCDPPHSEVIACVCFVEAW